jgi:hypothetical protein
VFLVVLGARQHFFELRARLDKALHVGTCHRYRHRVSGFRRVDLSQIGALSGPIPVIDLPAYVEGTRPGPACAGEDGPLTGSAAHVVDLVRG